VPDRQVAPDLPDAPLATLVSAIPSLAGHPATSEELGRFRKYLVLLRDWNRTHRITGYRTVDSMVRYLFLDSLLFASQLPKGTISVVDIGTGPGIPGVPLRIVLQDIRLTLIDSQRKQVSFLAALRRELALDDIAIHEGRAETLLKTHQGLRAAFDVVVMRAVGAPLLPAVVDYLRPGGILVAGGHPMTIGRRDLTEVGGLSSPMMVSVERLGLKRTFLVWHRADRI